MIERSLTPSVITSLSDSPVVFIQGARQVGKSTLAQSLAHHGHAARYLTLDDASTLAAAHGDPHGFIDGLEGPVILEEVQRAPSLALAIKRAVDHNRTPGRFLLTGSASVLVLPTLADSLAGRMEIHTLWPLSEGEKAGTKHAFVDTLFARTFKTATVTGQDWPDLVERMAAGGYPEMLRRASADRRRAWFGSYVTTILQRDVRDIANVRDLTDLPRLLALVAARAGSLMDYADLARGLSMPQTTLKRYAGLLESTFLIRTLPAWFTNLGKRLVKAPKVLLNDTGLLLYLLGTDAERLKTERTLAGSVLENFVALELLKQLGWSKTRATPHHFRTHGGDEVDLVLEDPAGRVVGIEVKAAASVDARDFKGLRTLASLAGGRFVRGVILYTGRDVVPFGQGLYAVPIPALWQARHQEQT